MCIRDSPIYDKKKCFLPCTYGYATTSRRSQGATYHHGCLWFDHSHPPERGYGYVGASRFRSKNGIYLFGKVRRTDWLPVRPKDQHHVDETIRGDQSDTDYDSADDEQGLRSSIERHRVWVKRGSRWDDYGTDSDDSGSEFAERSEADYSDGEAETIALDTVWDRFRAWQQSEGYPVAHSPIYPLQ